MSIAYYNGEFLDESEIRIPLSDRCIYFGDGIYDAAIGKRGDIYLFEEHLERFIGNAEKMDLNLQLTKDELRSLIIDTVKKSGLYEYFVYIQLTRTSKKRKHAYDDGQIPSLLITVNEHRFPLCEKPVRVITYPDIRYSMCNIKTLNLIPAVMASKKAKSMGCDEAIFIRDGIVTECAHSNVFTVKNGIVFTHPKDSFILPGITRERILYLCRSLGIEYVERKFDQNELFGADEVIISSTTRLASPVSEIDEFKVGCGEYPVANRIISSLWNDFWG